MLVLTRHVEESILINPGLLTEIRITVYDIRLDHRETRAKVRLGVQAPPEMVILREELVTKPLSKEGKTE